jgi:hypothetical protein
MGTVVTEPRLARIAAVGICRPMGATFQPEQILVRLEDDGERVTQVRLSSTRRLDAHRLLAGRPVDEALELVPRLFPLCRHAQTAAARDAVESALERPAAPAVRRRRDLEVALERADAHLLHIALSWPRLVGDAMPSDRLAAYASARQAARSEPGDRTVAELEAAGWALLDADVLRRALSFFAEPRFDDLASVWVPALPRLTPAWLSARLWSEPAFGRRPTVDGVPRDASVGGGSEGGLLGRALARLEAAQKALDALAAPPAPAAAVEGCAVRDTARGPLATAVRVEGGVWAASATVAPTEWTFHPDGVVQRLRGLPVDALRAGGLDALLALLDPCVEIAASWGADA